MVTMMTRRECDGSISLELDYGRNVPAVDNMKINRRYIITNGVRSGQKELIVQP